MIVIFNNNNNDNNNNTVQVFDMGEHADHI